MLSGKSRKEINFHGTRKDYALFFFVAFFFFAAMLVSSSSAKDGIGMRLFLSALCHEKFLKEIFIVTIDPELIIALKKFLVNDFFQKCVDNSKLFF